MLRTLIFIFKSTALSDFSGNAFYFKRIPKSGDASVQDASQSGWHHGRNETMSVVP